MTSSLFQCGDEAKSSLALPHQFTDVPPGPQAGGQGACDGGRRGDHHTDSDISVTFAEANIVHVRDTYWNGIYPFIDYSTGGIDGMIAASDANLAATTNDTIITPGHGRPVSNKAELKEFRDMHATRPSRRNQLPPSMPNGANLSSIPGTSPGWSMKASDRGPNRQTLSRPSQAQR